MTQVMQIPTFTPHCILFLFLLLLLIPLTLLVLPHAHDNNCVILLTIYITSIGAPTSTPTVSCLLTAPVSASSIGTVSPFFN